MPATPARIAFVINQYRLATAGPDAGVVAKYGTTARDTPDPIETFFVATGDAQIMADERLALLSADRRRATIVASGIRALPAALAVAPLMPVAHVTDTQRAIDRDAAVVELGLDFERDQTTFGVWG